jgi:hypothetical protein
MCPRAATHLAQEDAAEMWPLYCAPLASVCARRANRGEAELAFIAALASRHGACLHCLAAPRLSPLFALMPSSTAYVSSCYDIPELAFIAALAARHGACLHCLSAPRLSPLFALIPSSTAYVSSCYYVSSVVIYQKKMLQERGLSTARLSPLFALMPTAYVSSCY